MQYLVPVLLYSLLGIGLYIADAVAMAAFSDQLGFWAALFLGVSPIRIILRMSVLALLLILGYSSSKRLWEQQKPITSWQEDHTQERIWGSAESHERSQRILYHSLRMARMFKMSKQHQESLRTLCYCYDIGLIGVPNSILEKKAPLNAEDQKIMDQHIMEGAKILSVIKPLSSAADLVLKHEEYYNGRGYLGLKRNKIPLSVRIFQVAWMYDCMIYPSPHRRPMLCDEALLELEYYAGSALDPEVVAAFIKLMNKPTIFAPILGRSFSPRQL